ncbi:MAG: DUF4411 family protein [Chloroflexi bacterium]|nr:DUF4411 family protein [Chloroflexota bacterium]MCL5074871.1 DUF4411 family protein [Chloroflexota bacterium]
MTALPVYLLPVYLLDANVFIEAARRYYAFDIAPRFWEQLIEHAESGQVQSIDRIKVEIDRGKDDLKQWANGSFHQWFESTGHDDVVQAYRQVMTWAQGQSQFTDAAKAEFASAVDGWLIAYAKARGCVIVTLERFDANVRRRIPIPNVCRAFNIRYIDTFEMLRALGVKLS